MWGGRWATERGEKEERAGGREGAKEEAWSDWLADFEGGAFSSVESRGNRRTFFSKQQYWAPVLLLT